MGLYKPRTQYGFHSATFINRTTSLPYGMAKVLAGYTPAFTRETSELYGGSNPNPVDSEDGTIDSSLTLTLKEFKPFLFELAGYTVTDKYQGVDSYDGAAGSISDLTDEIGTSVYGASGVQSLAITTEANLKAGKYFITAGSAATKVDIYLLTDVNADRGTSTDYLTDDLKIAEDVSLSASAATVTGYGFSITGVASTNITTGDVGSFEVRSSNEGYSIYTLGDNPTPVEFGLYLVSQKKSNGEFSIDEYPRVKFNSVPAGMTSQEWLEAELSIKVLFDSTAGYAVRRRDIIKDLS